MTFNNMWRINATVEWAESGWKRTTQIPTFWLDGDQLGIVDTVHATRITSDMILDVFGNATSVSVKAMRFVDGKPQLKGD